MADEDDVPNEDAETDEETDEAKAAAALEKVSLEPGLYPGMDFDSYARVDAINFSILSKFKDTAAHAHHALTHEPASTPSFHLGYLVHLSLLEPQSFVKRVVKRPKLDRRTKAGKVAHAMFEAKYRGYEFASDSEWETCVNLARSVSQHATAREILYGTGASELTAVWKDKETRLLCKGRLDRVAVVNATAVVLDLKTVGEVASLRNWQRSITNYAYVEQAAMYLDGLQQLVPVDAGRHFLWLVCEVDPPYLVRMFDAEEDAIEYGHRLYRDHLRQYAECKRTGVWPGYPEGVETVGLPAWIQKTYDSML